MHAQCFTRLVSCRMAQPGRSPPLSTPAPFVRWSPSPSAQCCVSRSRPPSLCRLMAVSALCQPPPTDCLSQTIPVSPAPPTVSTSSPEPPDGARLHEVRGVDLLRPAATAGQAAAGRQTGSCAPPRGTWGWLPSCLYAIALNPLPIARGGGGAYAPLRTGPALSCAEPGPINE